MGTIKNVSWKFGFSVQILFSYSECIQYIYVYIVLNKIQQYEKKKTIQKIK